MTTIQHGAQTETQDFLIEFPFRLQSALAQFAVAEDLHVQRMDDGAKDRLLRIRDAEYTEDGKLTKFTQLPDCMFAGDIGPDIDEIDEFCSSNYMLIAPSPERAKEFNFALKLVGNSASALYIGFKTTTPAKYFLGTRVWAPLPVTWPPTPCFSFRPGLPSILPAGLRRGLSVTS